MEKKINLHTNDNYTIYGTLNSNKLKNSKIVIFVHWLTWNQDEHHYFNAVPFFLKNGFDTFRFSFYPDEDNARQLSKSSIKTHAEDLLIIINYFEKIYWKLFLVGHSLGTFVILNTDLTNISKIVLRDPTKGMQSLEEKGCIYNETLRKYILHWWQEILIGQDMVNDWQKASNIEESVKKITKPCKIIFAGNNNIYEARKPFLANIKVPYESVIINNASHGFIEEGTEQKLFEETLKWLTTK